MECGASLDKENQIDVKSPLQMLDVHFRQAAAAVVKWKHTIEADPSKYAEIEEAVHEEFRKGADMVLAGLLVMMHGLRSFDVAAEQTRKNYAVTLTRGRVRQIQVRLLGGLVIWLRSVYCEPSRRWLRENNPDKIPGIYIGLAQCGLGHGVTPALESTIARTVAGMHSFDFAVDELTRRGIKMSYKAVRRVAYECGEGILTLRKRDIVRMREGKLIASSELAGCHIVAEIDGGRMKMRGAMSPRKESEFQIRENVEESESTTAIEHNAKLAEDGGRAKSKKKPRKTYRTDWREPKLVTIFVIGPDGKQLKKSKAWIDGTLQGPDALAEIVAMMLYRLGAGQAASITFISDGAPWIWDRIDPILRMAKIPTTVMIHKILDCCHAIGQMHGALKSFGMSETMVKGLNRVHRKQIRDGDWRLVVQSLEKRLSRHPEFRGESRQIVERSINYLRNHGESGHMDYPKFALMGLPLGSGAIESGIRRVINMRLKGNSVFWQSENAESILQLRCQYISKRLDAGLVAKRVELSLNGKLDWKWQPIDHPKPDHSLSTSA